MWSGARHLNPGASRSRTVERLVQMRAKRSDPVRNVSRGPWSRPDSGQSSGDADLSLCVLGNPEAGLHQVVAVGTLATR